MRRLTYRRRNGHVRMVDVGSKRITRREAVATGTIQLSPATVRLLKANGLPKGDVLTVAKVAGVLAAKRVDEFIPLCHSIPLDHVDVHVGISDDRVHLTATVRCHGRTGVEMEALTAVAVASLTIYDMCKAVDQAMTLGPIALAQKSGGRSGRYVRE